MYGRFGARCASKPGPELTRGKSGEAGGMDPIDVVAIPTVDMGTRAGESDTLFARNVLPAAG